MTYWFDVYLRLAGPLIGALPWDGEELTGWHRLALLTSGAKLTLEPMPHALGDGTDLSDGETAKFSGAVLWVAEEEWATLRDTYHNQKCDLVLFDHQAAVVVAVVYGMQMNISSILTSGDARLITVTGSRSTSNAGAEKIRVISAQQVATPECSLDDDPEAAYYEEQTIEFADITCATEGATIWVSVDGGAWQQWSDMDQVATPECSLDDDPVAPYYEEQTIEFEDITCATEDATIWVSVDLGEWEEWKAAEAPAGAFDATFDASFG